MIPGPVEISPGVQRAFSAAPPSHLAPELIEAFGSSLEKMRRVFCAAETAQPFVLGGGGTAAMDMACANLVDPGTRAIVVHTGFFSDRIAEMVRRRGADVLDVRAGLGDAPTLESVRAAAEARWPRDRPSALFATHVDTSTGVLLDPRPLAAWAREVGALSVFDGVCATAAERFEMADLEADVYLTASQKALGLPPGLALLMASPRALEARAALRTPPPAYLDWSSWLPVMRAYEERRPSYFSTPPTNLILALEVGLDEILADGMERRFERHREAALRLRAVWRALGLVAVPLHDDRTPHTLSALRYPAGTDASLVRRILERGVVVAGGLHPEIRDAYFRVGHMGYAVTQPEMLRRTVEAIAGALRETDARVDVAAAIRIFEETAPETRRAPPERRP